MLNEIVPTQKISHIFLYMWKLKLTPTKKYPCVLVLLQTVLCQSFTYVFVEQNGMNYILILIIMTVFMNEVEYLFIYGPCLLFCWTLYSLFNFYSLKIFYWL